MTDTKAMLERLEKLEMRQAFQEHTIEELNSTITDQWKLIDSLKRELARLTDQVREVESNVDQAGQKEPPPPHY
ncbi:SlyX family protein [Mariluticola halotolerans]|uniref:SlyX family protein n=1 Tax=Mariluticola halotolerans TaxID=2909283 RepID=UPI0026E36B37|nr:SlyX family protein [Mariluticola halotolerans]UJQ94069.1 SlyX family protein [Mariluticola halotolerans]